ncbi:MAG: hypothetical protein DHS20C18_05720 [Saprospiraceae bacterium]|nr:MAG: hypothetical protein DHS20C18_05720 [Saprospiraceae bacterium]
MNRILFFFCLSVLLLNTNLQAQITGGFKTGLNFSTFNGPSEVDGNGSNLETLKLNSGFHISGMINFHITDLFGIRTEIMYSQKGTDYTFNGQSFWIFYPDPDTEILNKGGNRNLKLSISNAYIDLPIMAYGRLGRLEASAGINIGILVSARAQGEITYDGTNIEPFTIALDYRFAADEEEKVATGENSQVAYTTNSGVPVRVPVTAGAYYGIFGRNKRLYNVFDLGLNAGLSFYLNKGLFLGFRLNYGLLDATNNDQDFSNANLGEQDNFLKLDDRDTNMSLQASIGFSF